MASASFYHQYSSSSTALTCRLLHSAQLGTDRLRPTHPGLRHPAIPPALFLLGYFPHGYHNLDVNKKLSYRRDSARLRSLLCSRSYEVTDFDTNRKPVRDSRLVNNTTLHPSSHRFTVAQYWSIYRLRQAGASF